MVKKLELEELRKAAWDLNELIDDLNEPIDIDADYDKLKKELKEVGEILEKEDLITESAHKILKQICDKKEYPEPDKFADEIDEGPAPVEKEELEKKEGKKEAPKKEGKKEAPKKEGGKEASKKTEKKSDVKRSPFGAKEGSQVFIIDTLLVAGASTLKELAKKAKTNEARVRTHFNYLKNKKMVTITETKDGKFKAEK